MSTPYTPTVNLPFAGPNGGLSIGGISYIVEGDTEMPHPTRQIQRRDQNGDESDFMIRAEPSTNIPAKLQLATSVTTLPSLGITFLAPGQSGAGGANSAGVACVVTDVTPKYPQGGIWYVDIKYRALSLLTT